MEKTLYENIFQRIREFSTACGVSSAIYDFAEHDFSSKTPCTFCRDCEFTKRNKCDPKTAHTYGCFEAERWNGLYVYYCPASLAFTATVIYQDRHSAFAVISGPFIMGQLEDTITESGDYISKSLLMLPKKTPEEIHALSQLQWILSVHLSDKTPGLTESAKKNQSELQNLLYDLRGTEQNITSSAYPMDLEKRLQSMIIRGDKKGAQQLINQLLGILYFQTAGDFSQIKARAKELVTLFSRASIEGGANISDIFGQTKNNSSDIDRFSTLDDLSFYLTNLFHRFVAYTFDFSRFKHSDIVQKVVLYIRDNFDGRISLEDAAAHVGLSRSYLSLIFRDELATSFSDFVNQTRIKKCEELLLTQDLKLAEIANLVGFCDQSYFTKVFHREVGMSPGEYRKKGGKRTKNDQANSPQPK